MAAKIFISYRRRNSEDAAGRLATWLDAGPFRGRVFIDHEGLADSPNWVLELERQVAASEAMVCVIHPTWADERDANGLPRIKKDDDYVRWELAQAFIRGIPVIPVLLNGAHMPRPDELPDNLVLLTQIQALPLRSARFKEDADRIARRIKKEIEARRRSGWSRRVVATIAVIALVVGAGVGAFLAAHLGGPPPAVVVDTTVAAASRIGELEAELAEANATIQAAQGQLADTNTKLAQLAKARDDALKAADDQRRLAGGLAKKLASSKLAGAGALKRAEDSEKARSEAVAEVERLSDMLAAAAKDAKQVQEEKRTIAASSLL